VEQITLTTPALLFPAISLLLLAFTNRFLATASLVRQLHSNHQKDPQRSVIIGQIKNLKTRLSLIRNMQLFAVLSFFCCVLSMIFIFTDQSFIGGCIFTASMFLLLIALGISVREIQISTRALELELSGIELDS
jgi:hypothetical protein